jgi:caffeoyl-CoA O-methyltransferase
MISVVISKIKGNDEYDIKQFMYFSGINYYYQVSIERTLIPDYMKKHNLSIIFLTVAFLGLLPLSADSQTLKENPALDEKVKKFLVDHSRQWYDMNVPSIDGQLLYDIIIKNNYKSALEIGTSTGHSGIWTAWALSKTGGKLITIDIDEGRHNQALQNFKAAGLSEYIDARLADAHELVKQLKGPFDFVFSDADKEWYKNYFIDVDPKLIVGGCFTAHNITDRSYGGPGGSGGPGGRGGRGGYGPAGGQGAFLDYVKSLSNYETTVNNNGGGVSISFKKAEK